MTLPTMHCDRGTPNWLIYGGASLLEVSPWTLETSVDIISVGSGDNRGNGGSIQPTAVSKLRLFRPPHICLCLSEETLKASGPLLSGVYARGSKKSHTGGKCVTCSGLTNSREGQLLR